MLDHLRRMFVYDDWANREALASIWNAGAPARSVSLMAHLVAVEWLWMARLKREKSKFAVWPPLELEQCEAELDPLRTAWQCYLDVVDLEAPVGYVNSKGEEWTNTAGDILHHVIAHSVYHRGQIAADVRAAGFTPAYTDLIEWARRGHR